MHELSYSALCVQMARCTCVCWTHLDTPVQWSHWRVL